MPLLRRCTPATRCCHTVLSQMLMELGVDEETATEDACRIEHVISEKSFAAVQAHLEQVTKMREDAHGQ